MKAPRPPAILPRQLPDRDQPHLQKKKMVVVVIVGLLILLAAALLWQGLALAGG